MKNVEFAVLPAGDEFLRHTWLTETLHNTFYSTIILLVLHSYCHFLGDAVLTEIYICGPETRATLEANRTLRDDGGTAARSHQVMDLEKNL